MSRRKSSLATFEKLSPNRTSPRNKSIRRHTPHCVAGNLSAETTLGLSMFQNYSTTKGCSTTYAIGTNGGIGLGVVETDRPWTSSSSTNDNQAVTYEIANNSGAPDWRMSDEAINSWLDLAVDVTLAYGFKKVNYKEKPVNITGSAAVENWIASWANPDEMIITLHNWYANKACPGPYFTRQLPWLVKQINHRLSGGVPERFIGEGASSMVIIPSTTPILKQGSSGTHVSDAQIKLNKHGANPVLSVDGSFGPATVTAVRAFQMKKNLTVDGVIGPATWAELNKEIDTSTQSPTAIVTPEEIVDVFYAVKINVSALNIRQGPSINSPIVKTLVNDRNVYTIVNETDGPVDSSGTITRWGKLKSEIGWLALRHVEKV